MFAARDNTNSYSNVRNARDKYIHRFAVHRLPAPEFTAQPANTSADGVPGIDGLAVCRQAAFQFRDTDLAHGPIERPNAGQPPQ